MKDGGPGDSGISHIFFDTYTNSLKADRKTLGGMGVHWDSLELIALTWLHLDSLKTMCGAGVVKTSGTIGTGERAW